MNRFLTTLSLMLAVLIGSTGCNTVTTLQNRGPSTMLEQKIATLKRTNACRNCYLAWSEFNYANFKEGNLEGANLQRAYLRNATLKGANLRRVDLQEAELRNANETNQD